MAALVFEGKIKVSSVLPLLSARSIYVMDKGKRKRNVAQLTVLALPLPN
jgi:hypothetical protein